MPIPSSRRTPSNTPPRTTAASESETTPGVASNSGSSTQPLGHNPNKPPAGRPRAVASWPGAKLSAASAVKSATNSEMKELAGLGYLLSGYFHQDWKSNIDSSHDNISDIQKTLQSFLKKEKSETADQLEFDLSTLKRTKPNSEQLQTLLPGLEEAADILGMDAQACLNQLTQLLEVEFKNRNSPQK
jgi:hypothetical protein